MTTHYDIDPAHTSAHFSVRHMMVSTVRGHFDKVAGALVLDDADPRKSRLEVTIDAASVNTRNEQRDTHLRSADFFDVEHHPTLRFVSTKVERQADGGYLVLGDLTMRGATHPVTLVVEPLSDAQKSPWGQTVRGASATGKLHRKQWGLNWNSALEAGGVLVGDEIKLEIDAELVEKAAAVATAA